MSSKSLYLVLSWHTASVKGNRDTDTNPSRGYEKFTMGGSAITRKDRNNPFLLRSIIYEEKIKNITSRVCLPTISTTFKNEVVHPVLRGHDVNALEVWNNMPMYDNHFLKRIYDTHGNTRNFTKNRRLPVGYSIQDFALTKCTPSIPSRQCKEVNHHPMTYPTRFSYKQQWRTNQKHFNADFRRSWKRDT